MMLRPRVLTSPVAHLSVFYRGYTIGARAGHGFACARERIEAAKEAFRAYASRQGRALDENGRAAYGSPLHTELGNNYRKAQMKSMPNRAPC